MLEGGGAAGCAGVCEVWGGDTDGVSGRSIDNPAQQPR